MLWPNPGNWVNNPPLPWELKSPPVVGAEGAPKRFPEVFAPKREPVVAVAEIVGPPNKLVPEKTDDPVPYAVVEGWNLNVPAFPKRELVVPAAPPKRDVEFAGPPAVA